MTAQLQNEAAVVIQHPTNTSDSVSPAAGFGAATLAARVSWSEMAPRAVASVLARQPDMCAVMQANAPLQLPA